MVWVAFSICINLDKYSRKKFGFGAVTHDGFALLCFASLLIAFGSSNWAELTGFPTWFMHEHGWVLTIQSVCCYRSMVVVVVVGTRNA